MGMPSSMYRKRLLVVMGWRMLISCCSLPPRFTMNTPLTLFNRLSIRCALVSSINCLLMTAMATGASLLFSAVRLALTTICCSVLLPGVNAMETMDRFLVLMLCDSNPVKLIANVSSLVVMANFPKASVVLVCCLSEIAAPCNGSLLTASYTLPDMVRAVCAEAGSMAVIKNRYSNIFFMISYLLLDSRYMSVPMLASMSMRSMDVSTLAFFIADKRSASLLKCRDINLFEVVNNVLQLGNKLHV